MLPLGRATGMLLVANWKLMRGALMGERASAAHVGDDVGG
jgi:hypothetical protein